MKTHTKSSNYCYSDNTGRKTLRSESEQKGKQTSGQHQKESQQDRHASNQAPAYFDQDPMAGQYHQKQGRNATRGPFASSEAHSAAATEQLKLISHGIA